MELREFLNNIPKMPSHYCRKDTNKLYLEPHFCSYSEFHREYSEWCARKQCKAYQRTAFMQEIHRQNISIFTPKKDQCDLCCAYSKGNADAEKYMEHITRKEEARVEKNQDKSNADARNMVLCVDVQRVLLAPALKASALYYKTKLQVHNYSIYNLGTRDCVCYLWNETEGAVTANEFATCLFDFLESKKDDFDTVTVISDGCTYQNRNRVLTTALRLFCVKYEKILVQKILERGHTQMEVDSVHATVERQLKHVEVYLPLDYVHLIRSARRKPCPYEVKYLDFKFFKDFEKFGTGEVKSIKPGT